MKPHYIFFLSLFLMGSFLSVAGHTWKVSDPITGNQSLLVDLRPQVEKQPLHEELVFHWTRQSVINTVPPVPAAPAQTLAIALPKKDCDCPAKQSMAAFFQDEPLTPEEELTIKAEVDAHADTEWWNEVDNPGLFSFGICESLVNGVGYQTGLNHPKGLVNIIKTGHKAYNKMIDPDVPVTGTAEEMTAKQVYIGKVFFQKYVLHQKCQIKDFLEYQSQPEREELLLSLEGKPIIYADLFNPGSKYNLLTRLDSVEYEGKSGVETILNNYLLFEAEIDSLAEFKSLLEQIMMTRKGEDIAKFAVRYYVEFGFDK